MDAIDKLLSQIKADTPKPSKPISQKPIIVPLPSNSEDIDNLLAEVQADFQNQSTTPAALKNNPPIIESILAQVKTHYDEQDKTRSQNEQQQLQAEQLKQIEKLKIRAKSWLKQLDPLSTEGLWFEQFAEGYPTKLAAAINYLQES
ncbi:salt stress protein, Slr1339 family [Synechocystis sp. PCC 7509]|uniref:salt stress protein, Slr1339 family n=1 Tax=Synechocystis sp. PCC 7509 TaxID=927677 RepID=UPI0002AC9EDE|nr:hypothetical protein [Synechocystis sp. PCC 7509]